MTRDQRSRRSSAQHLWTIAILLVCQSSLFAQPPLNARQKKQLQQRAEQQKKMIAENTPVLPSDPQLLNLHKEFVVKAEKLALEFERKKQFGKAREVYESLVRLVPNYGPAEAGVQRILDGQSVQDRKLTEVYANREWQDSGATLQAGMPVKVRVQGTWKVVFETGSKGIEIPEKMEPRDKRIKLGTLIGVIASSPTDLKEGKPMIFESEKDFVARESGRLYLRMFDVDPTDNEGKLMVMIQSTFGK